MVGGGVAGEALFGEGCHPTPIRRGGEPLPGTAPPLLPPRHSAKVSELVGVVAELAQTAPVATAVTATAVTATAHAATFSAATARAILNDAACAVAATAVAVTAVATGAV